MNLFQKTLLITSMTFSGLLAQKNDAQAQQRLPDFDPKKVSKKQLAHFDPYLLSAFERVNSVQFDTIHLGNKKIELYAEISGKEIRRTDAFKTAKGVENGKLTVHLKDLDHNKKFDRAEVLDLMALDVNKAGELTEHNIIYRNIQDPAKPLPQNVSIFTESPNSSFHAEASSADKKESTRAVFDMKVKNLSGAKSKFIDFAGRENLFFGSIPSLLNSLRRMHGEVPRIPEPASKTIQPVIMENFTEIYSMGIDSTGKEKELFVYGRDAKGHDTDIRGKDKNNNQKLDPPEINYAHTVIEEGILNGMELTVIDDSSPKGEFLRRREIISIPKDKATALSDNLWELAKTDSDYLESSTKYIETIKKGLTEEADDIILLNAFNTNAAEAARLGTPFQHILKLAAKQVPNP